MCVFSGCLMYWLIGYGFANEDSDSGFIGTKLFVPRSHLLSNSRNVSVDNWFSQVQWLCFCYSDGCYSDTHCMNIQPCESGFQILRDLDIKMHALL